MIVGGIVMMNTAQTENNSASTSHTSLTGRAADLLEKDINHGSSTPISIPTPAIIIIFGLMVFAVGIYDHRRIP